MPDEKINSITIEEILKYRTKAMRDASTARTALFAQLREMAGEQTNLDLPLFRDRVRERLVEYQEKLTALTNERSALKWRMILDSAKGLTAGASAAAAGGVFHVALPVGLSAALLGASAWGLGKIQEYLPDIKGLLADERRIKGSNEFAVFRHFSNLKELD